MTKDYIDFNHVHSDHAAAHKRLLNWGAWCKDGKGTSIVPMFRGYKSKWRQWHEPEVRDVIDGIDAQRVQKMMIGMPIDSRRCLAWYYTSNKSPATACRELKLTKEGLNGLLFLSRKKILG